VRFLFHDDAGAVRIILKGEDFKYVVKVRRHRAGDTLALRRRDRSGTLYTYRLVSADGRQAALQLLAEEEMPLTAKKPLHLGWCVIDPKSVEKVLPQLNEMGVAKITFIACDRSQRQFRQDFERLNRILEASMQQCGRSDRMRLESATLEAFIAAHPQTVVLDFCDDVLAQTADVDTVLIGCEGGFSPEERELLAACRTARFDTPFILRSESAAVAAAANILL
jgi:16S rRNA (uracil1498-N3)-methyltransferase